MRVRKWLMKQQWRIIQIRGIWGLFYGIMLLAISYYEYVPVISEISTYGPFIFAGLIMIVFLVLGYIYDRVLVMWAPSQEVMMERNPYQYVPSPKDHIFWFPIYAALLDASEKIARDMNIDTYILDETREHYAALSQLKPERSQDIDKGIELRKKFMKKHSFVDIDESKE